MKRFIDLQEATGTVSFTFGRFNPPTIGHEKLCDAVKKANPSDYKIFASQSQNPKKDPLQYAKKIAYMKKSFPKHKRNIVVSKSRNIFEILVELNSYENLIMVVGSDRVAEFKKIINQKHTRHFPSGTQLYFVKRLRKVNGKPYLISNAFLKYNLCFGLNKNYFTEEGSSQSLIYILKNNFGINFTENSQYICAKELSENDSDALNKSPGIPCLSQECLLYNNDNQLVLVDQNITFNTLMFNSKS